MKRVLPLVTAVAIAFSGLVSLPAQASVVDPIAPGDWIYLKHSDGNIYSTTSDEDAGSRTEIALTTGVANPISSPEWPRAFDADAKNNVIHLLSGTENVSPYIYKIRTFSFATESFSDPITLDMDVFRAAHLSSWGKYYVVGSPNGSSGLSALDYLFELDPATGAMTRILMWTSGAPSLIWDWDGKLYFASDMISISVFNPETKSIAMEAPSRALPNASSMTFFAQTSPTSGIGRRWNDDMAKVTNLTISPAQTAITNVGSVRVFDIAVDQTFVCPGAASGYGSVANPFLIGTATELAAIGTCPSAANYLLTDDIDFLGGALTPLFASGFRGVFDGGGHEISNFVVTTASYGGLFEKIVGGKVMNLRISDAEVSSVKDTGLLAGLIVYATIQGVTAEGEVINTNPTLNINYYSGGLVGYADGASSIIKESGFNGTVSGRHIGGALGWGDAVIRDVYVRGTLNPVTTSNMGWPNAVPALLAAGGSVSSTRTYVSIERDATATLDFSDRPAGVNGASSSAFHMTGSGVPTMQNSDVKTDLELKDLATFSSWSIGQGFDAAKIWGLCAAVNDGFPFITASYSANPCVSAQASVPTAVVPLAVIQISLASLGANTQEGAAAAAAGITPGSEVAITGEAVETIVEVAVGAVDAPILDISNQTLTFEVPKSLTAGFYDLTLVSTDFGSITHQGAIRVTTNQSFKLAWTKKVGNKVNLYSTLPNGFRFYVNGKEVKTKIGSRLVATITLETGKNVISIRRDGKQVRRVAYTG